MIAEPATSGDARSGSLWSTLAGIDGRSLAALRIGLAAVVLADLVLRGRHLAAHYSDRGVLPVQDAVRWLGAQSKLVVHLYHGAVWYEALLFGLAAIAATALAIGYRTRLATVITWFLVASLQARNPTLNNGGDHLLRIMLFWAMFVPLGAAWSVDRVHSSGGDDSAATPRVITSVATLAIQLQLCLMYWFTAVLKWDPVWFESYTATEMALNVDYLTTSWGELLLNYPALLAGLTAFTIWLEIIGPILVWSPVWTGPLRFLVVLAFIAFHLIGLAPALHIGLFPWICAVAWLMFLPSWMWDRLARERPGAFDRFDRGLRHLAARLPLPRLIPSPRWARFGSRIASVVAGLLLIFIVAWNISTLEKERHDELVGSTLSTAVRSSGLNQRWAMFAPHPPLDDGWYVMPGRTAGGREVDVWRRRPVSWTKPRDVAASFGSKRWNKYLVNLSAQGYRYHRPLFGEYVCRTWNSEHEGDDRLVEFSMIFVLERFEAPAAEPEPLVLWVQQCR